MASDEEGRAKPRFRGLSPVRLSASKARQMFPAYRPTRPPRASDPRCCVHGGRSQPVVAIELVHGGDEPVSQHVWVHPGRPHPGLGREVA